MSLLISGVQLVAPGMVNVTEGERQQICVTIQRDDPPRDRERSVGITFGFFPVGKGTLLN